MKYVVYCNEQPRAAFIGYSWESVENFIRENDSWNRSINGWNCELDTYEIVSVPLK